MASSTGTALRYAGNRDSLAMFQPLVGASLSSLRLLFSTLEHEPITPGRYRARFVGPWWLRLSAGPSVALGGLRGFWGKQLNPDGRAVNLLARGDALVEALQMRVETLESLVDGRPCTRLSYPAGPWPWSRVVDELRPLGGGVVLGMTLVQWGPLRRRGFPFALLRDER